jgi:hypothetical protein
VVEWKTNLIALPLSGASRWLAAICPHRNLRPNALPKAVRLTGKEQARLWIHGFALVDFPRLCASFIIWSAPEATPPSTRSPLLCQ